MTLKSNIPHNQLSRAVGTSVEAFETTNDEVVRTTNGKAVEQIPMLLE